MKLIFLPIVWLALTISTVYSQGNHCDCSDNLSKLVLKTEENYAGFPTKINGENRSKYKSLVESLKIRTGPEVDPKKCFYLLKEYVRFFEDKHFILSYYNENDFDIEIIALSEDEFKNENKKRRMAPVEGVWVNADSTLKLAIQKYSPKTYKAVVLQSENPDLPIGLVYMTLTEDREGFVSKQYNSFITTEVPAKLKGNLLQVWNFEMFGKIFPNELTEAERQELDTWASHNNGLDFQVLSSSTAYLKIPTFKNNDDKIQQLVSKNDSIIKTREHLIVDLSGNGGGNTGWISFLPYFMTNPIVQYDSYLRVTPDNVKLKLADLEPFVINPIPDEYKKYFPDEVVSKYSKAYRELSVTEELFYPIPSVTFPLDSITSNPKTIALIVDDLCGSSAEYFFSISKQSKKTTTYGVNTIGMMDYEGMSIPTPLPYDKYILTIPIAKSSWTDAAPIDKVGFRPDVLLEGVERANWVKFVQEDLEKTQAPNY